jgi:hypothetical protein
VLQHCNLTVSSEVSLAVASVLCTTGKEDVDHAHQLKYAAKPEGCNAPHKHYHYYYMPHTSIQFPCKAAFLSSQALALSACLCFSLSLALALS